MSDFLFCTETLNQHGVTAVHNRDSKILKVVVNVCDFSKHREQKSVSISEAFHKI